MRLSPKYGVNPSICVCLYCQKEGDLILNGLLKGDAEAPRRVIASSSPCDGCEVFAKYSTEGVFLLEAEERDGQPIPTGTYAVVKDAAVRRMLTDPAMTEAALKHRIAFVDTEAWVRLGLNKLGDDS